MAPKACQSLSNSRLTTVYKLASIGFVNVAVESRVLPEPAWSTSAAKTPPVAVAGRVYVFGYGGVNSPEPASKSSTNKVVKSGSSSVVNDQVVAEALQVSFLQTTLHS